MIDNQDQPQPVSKLRQILDIMADLLARQRELASICRQLDWDNRELRQRLEALERQAAAYRKKYPNG
jgi:hypothetical protein